MAEEMLMTNIKYLHHKSGISRVKWCKRMGFSVKTVDGWWSGQINPQLKHIKILSNKCKVSIDYLVRNDLSKTPTETIKANYYFIQRMMKL